MGIVFPKPDLEQFLRTYTISHFTVNEKETQLVFSSNINGKFNLWAMDLPQLSPYPLTFNDRESQFVKMDPEGRFLLTAFDNDGDENFQIYALRPEGGVPLPLITGEKQEKYFFAALSKDGNRLYYNSSKDNPHYFDTRLYHIDTREDKLLLKGEEAPTYLESISPTEKAFAYLKMFANTYILGYVQAGDAFISVTPDENVAHTVFDLTFVDDNTLLFLTNFGEEFSYLARFDIENQAFTPLLKLAKEDMRSLKWHKETETAYIVTEKGVCDALFAYSLKEDTYEKIALPIETVQQLLVAQSGNLYVLGRSATQSFNLYTRGDNRGWTALTNNRVPGLSQDQLVDPDVVTYPSYDNTSIEALLFRANADVANGYTIFWPHGGPQAAERKSFRGAFQFLLGQGYNLFAPNFRGSTGYGSSFTKLVEGDWGEGPRLDCVAGIEWLFEQGITNRDKLFLFGGSYGGWLYDTPSRRASS
ncbi:dipeptidyl aminopeptidase/acylaminoacyl peptidase [Pullulanibacillus pueri]|uniref:Peptidase S9 prolyl oligopeptidase catalytic domain-containing protein n=1 Tax=Pullulanibacillus pueri TaxID=1437324 RepID=A0A8J2ZRJ7_9BACL|nr:dipeptidyl aminopeptidase/acylaminoacyl peptidase [Pullulanibacillus pueri]GGH73865.1 hypothetical protein GCM10007096_01530 [Pullulanibacillus pueri]